jgi:hypothetical protein
MMIPMPFGAETRKTAIHPYLEAVRPGDWQAAPAILKALSILAPRSHALRSSVGIVTTLWQCFTKMNFGL